MKSSLLITGASGVIGAALAQRMAHDPQWEGCRFVLHGRSESKLEKVADQVRSAGRECETWVSDFGAEGAFEQARELVVSKGPWIAMALVAGNNHDHGLLNLSEADWDTVCRENTGVHGVLLEALFREGRALPGGSALLFGSIVAVRGNWGQTGYAAAKGMLEDLMKMKQMRAAALNWRLNLFLPPLVESPLLANLNMENRKRLFSGRLLHDPDPARSAAHQACFLLSKRSSYVHACVWHGDSRISSLPWRK